MCKALNVSYLDYKILGFRKTDCWNCMKKKTKQKKRNHITVNVVKLESGLIIYVGDFIYISSSEKKFSMFFLRIFLFLEPSALSARTK